jgi:hypothetical protein
MYNSRFPPIVLEGAIRESKPMLKQAIPISASLSTAYSLMSLFPVEPGLVPEF